MNEPEEYEDDTVYEPKGFLTASGIREDADWNIDE